MYAQGRGVEQRREGGNTLAENGKQDYSQHWQGLWPADVRTFNINLPLVPKSSKLYSAYIVSDKILCHV